MAFTRRCTIEVLASQVTGTLTDFPVLISKTHNDLKLVANGGYVENASGYDIRVFSDAALTSSISFELVYYDGTAGTVIMWAKISSCAVGSQYRLGFGDAALNTNASSTATWRSEYKGVWHGGDGSTLSLADSTSNGNTLTLAGSGTVAGAGKISGAFVFNGSGWATAGDPSSLDMTAAVSYSHWMKTNSGAVSFTMNKASAAGGNGYEFLYNAGDLTARNQITGIGYNTPTGSGFGNSAWHLAYAVISNIDNNFALYADGGLVGFNAITIGDMSSATEFQLGAREGGNRYTGSEEEARVYQGVLTGDWIAAEFKSQNAPASFASYTFDSPTPPPSGLWPIIVVCG